MKVYKGSCASPGLVLGQVSRLEHHVETTTVGPFKPSRELQLLTDAIRTAQDELESMADRAAPSEQAIFQFQSMMLDDEGMMNEVRFCINAGIGAAAAMNQVGQRYADQLANMKDNPYMQLRSVDILDASRRVINIITNRPRMWLALDHPVILAAERLMPTDLFSVPSGMILGIITAEGSGQSHAAIIARAMNIPGIVQVGRDFLDDCDGRTVILDATGGQCTLDPDAAARQQAETRICELQRENEEMGQLHALPNRTKDGQPFELLANCFGPEDIDTAMQSGAQGVGLLRTGYMMLPGRILDEQEQYFFYCSCLAAAKGCPVTVRTFDFGSDRTISDAYQGLQSSKLGLRGIRNSLRQPHQFETQLCALLRAAARGPLRVMFPMVTNVEDWDAAMRVVERCREHLRERGVAFNEDTKFGVMLSVPAACLTAEEFVEHGVDFLVVGTNDLTQYTHAADRELASAEHYYRPASKAMKKLITMVMDAAKVRNVPVTICGRQPSQHGAVFAAGPAQLLGESAEPFECEESSAGSRDINPENNKKAAATQLLFCYSRFPVRVITEASTASGAVSHRRMRGPRPTVLAPAFAAISASSAAKPPSAPVTMAIFSFLPSAGAVSASSWRRGAPPHS